MNEWMNEWMVLQATILHCKATLGQGQSRLTRQILVWIVPQVQDQSLGHYNETQAHVNTIKYSFQDHTVHWSTFHQDHTVHWSTFHQDHTVHWSTFHPQDTMNPSTSLLWQCTDFEYCLSTLRNPQRLVAMSGNLGIYSGRNTYTYTANSGYYGTFTFCGFRGKRN